MTKLIENWRKLLRVKESKEHETACIAQESAIG